MEATVVEVLAKFRADVSGFNQRVSEVETRIRDLQKTTQNSGSGISDAFSNMSSAAQRFGRSVAGISAIAGGALVAFGVQSFNAAARVEELDIALQAVGWSTGIGYEALRDAAQATKEVGIEMEIAQQSVLKFAQNNLDLAQASEVAKVAQDLAIIGGMNSTDTYNRLTHAIITGRSEVLKSVGIQKSAGQAYAQFAKTLGKTTKELTYQERQAAVLNLVLDEGKRVAGAYSASMTTPGKVLRSFARITNELQVAMGTALTQAFGPMIMATYNLYKEVVKLVSEGGALYPIIQAIGAVLTNLLTPITQAFQKAADFAKGLNGVATSADEAKSRFEGLAPFIEQTATQIQRFLPVIGALGGALAAWGGAELLRGVPILGNFLGMLNPVAVAITLLVALSPKLRDAFVQLLDSLKPLLPVFMAVGAVIVDVLNIGLHYAAKAIVVLSKIITASIEFVKRYATVFQVLGGIFAVVTIAIMAYLVQVKLYNAYTKIMAIMTGIQTVATNKLTLAFKKLNLMMKLNPVGFIVAAVAALAAGFVLLWNRSEAFRKIIIAIGKAGIIGIGYLIQIVGKLATGLIKIHTGPLKLLLKGLELLGVDAAGTALRGIEKMTDNIGNFFQDTGEKVKSFADKLDGLEKKRFSLPKIGSEFKMPKIDVKKIWEGTDAPEVDDFTAGLGEGKGAKEAISNLRSILQDYKDFMRNEFSQGFTESAESARGSITKALDLVKKIFDEKGKELKGKALKQLEEAYWSLDKSIRKFIPQAEELGAAFQAINQALEEAQKELEDNIRERKAATDDLSELLRQPFGEPSEIQKALSSANATVDSIISMYDRLVDVVKRRFKGLEDMGRKNALLDFLRIQTEQLISLAKERDKAIKIWEKENDKLQQLLSEQDSFGKQLVSTVKNYGRALFDVSKTNEMTAVQAIKTSTGIVITAVQEASGGLDGVQKQLKERLATIRSFATNIRSLMAKGLSKDYIRQLLEAGPEAAGALAELLNTAGADQISEINYLYDEIGSIADTLGTEMASKFYNNQIMAQQAIVDAAQAKLNDIQQAMDAIAQAIMDQLSPLVDFGAQLGDDIAQAIIDGLNKRKDELIALANSIAAAVASALASATTSATGVVIPSTPTVIPPVTPPLVPDATDIPPPAKPKNTGSVSDWRRAEGFSITVNQSNYNPTGSLESATLVNKAVERKMAELARKKRME